MNKSLSEMIAEIDLDSADKIALRDHANELKQVAIELAKALENINSVTKKQFEEHPMYWATMANGASWDALSRAKEIIGGE